MSIPARADRRPNGLQSGAKVGGMSGQTEPEMHTPRCTRAPEVGGRKARPVFSQETGMRFPLAGPTGKRIPQFREIPGHTFPSGLKAESASRSEAKFRDAVSAGALGKRKGPLCRGPSQFKVAGKGIAPARCADGPLRRFRALRAPLANAHAFTQLRALTGFDSAWGPHKRKGPLCRGPSQFKVAGKGIEPLTRGFSVLCSTN